jgi:hypothetical protein
MDIRRNGSVNSDFYLAGPLNLNMTEKQAGTVMGVELLLSAKEFDSLYMLAAMENETIAFETLYETAWNRCDGCERDEALVGLNGLIGKVGEAGEGFMWIEYAPEAGYTFRTRWGKSWKQEKEDAGERMFDNGETKSETATKPKLKRNRILRAAYTIAAMAAAFMLIITMPAPKDAEDEFFFLPDEMVPLSDFPNFNHLFFDDISNLFNESEENSTDELADGERGEIE